MPLLCGKSRKATGNEGARHREWHVTKVSSLIQIANILFNGQHINPQATRLPLNPLFWFSKLYVQYSTLLYYQLI